MADRLGGGRGIRNEWDLLKISAGWVYLYNLVRPHYGAGMGEKPPIEKLRELGYDLPDEFALFPPVLLDTIITDWAVKGGNDVLAHYTYISFLKYGLTAPSFLL